jgi:predicted nuclease of restriction endonuclease-like (RecB) superfamily
MRAVALAFGGVVGRALTPAAEQGTVRGLVLDLTRSRCELLAENALLRHQLLVAARQAKRPKLRAADRLVLVGLAAMFANWRNALVLVQPETLLRWHRDLFARFWAGRTKPKTPPKSRLPEDHVTPEEEIKNPYVLEFLGLKDEYSESEVEEALIRHLEAFLLELGGDFAFVGRQRRLRVGDAWYRVDLLFFHRRLRCLVVVDLKLGEFSHADAGQMHLYLNYAREHWTMPDENPPVGLILCAKKEHAVARYALEGLPNKVLAAEYRTVLPEERLLVQEIEKTRRDFENRAALVQRSRRGKRRGRDS